MRRTVFTILSLTLGCSSDFNPDLGDLDETGSSATDGADGGASDDGEQDDGGGDDGGDVPTDDGDDGTSSNDNTNTDADGSDDGSDTSTSDGGTDDTGTDGGGTMLPGETCDPILNLYDCIEGYACLRHDSSINDDPVQGHIWTFECSAFLGPIADIDEWYLASCADEDCGPAGLCMYKSAFPNGACLTDNCCTKYCHVAEDECGLDMFCLDLTEGWPEASYTVPAGLGFCRVL